MDDYELHQFLDRYFGIVGYIIVMAKFINLLNFVRWLKYKSEVLVKFLLAWVEF